MNASLNFRTAPLHRTQQRIGQRIALVLLGTGLVGSEVLRLLATRNEFSAAIRLACVVNSHGMRCNGAQLSQHAAAQALPPRREGDLAAAIHTLRGSGEIAVMLDATASVQLADLHAEWLRQGVHVVSANKVALGGSLQRWESIAAARRNEAAVYGDSAVVGAGLPVLSTVRRLYRCGDRLRRFEGVLSSTLSYLLNRFDGSIPFSQLLQQARALGYTEPDPRIDLSGEDVSRKMLVLARSSGLYLQESDIRVDGVLPRELMSGDLAEFRARHDAVDALMHGRLAVARQRNRLLRYVASFDELGQARAGLEEVEHNHPAARLDGADSLFAFTTESYAERALVISGPGAGAMVTAQALLADVLEIVGQ